MQTAWIWMRRQVTRPLTQIQDVSHSGHILTDFERNAKQLGSHMQTAWIWMRRRVTRPLTQIQAI